MPSKRGRGRPALPPKEFKGEMFSVRLNQGEAREVLNAIEASGKKKPVWMREALLAKAKGH